MKITLPANMTLPTITHFIADSGATERLVKDIFTTFKTFIYKDSSARHGCYIAFYDRDTQRMVVEFFGNSSLVETDKKSKYLQCASEKITRMVRYHLESSFERIDEENEKYGGGVSFNDQLFIACSGFAPEIDEAISYIVGLSCIDWGNALNDYMEKTGNDFVPILCKHIGKIRSERK